MHDTSRFSCCPRCSNSHNNHDLDRKFECAQCGFEYYHNVGMAVGGFMVCAQQLLLVERAKAPWQGTYDVPGGFVDPNESAEAALSREIKEELGLSLDPEQFRYMRSFPNRYPYGGINYATCDMFFLITLEHKPSLHPDDDVAAARWADIQTLTPESFGIPSVQTGFAFFAANIAPVLDIT